MSENSARATIPGPRIRPSRPTCETEVADGQSHQVRRIGCGIRSDSRRSALSRVIAARDRESSWRLNFRRVGELHAGGSCNGTRRGVTACDWEQQVLAERLIGRQPRKAAFGPVAHLMRTVATVGT